LRKIAHPLNVDEIDIWLTLELICVFLEVRKIIVRIKIQFKKIIFKLLWLVYAKILVGNSKVDSKLVKKHLKNKSRHCSEYQM